MEQDDIPEMSMSPARQVEKEHPAIAPALMSPENPVDEPSEEAKSCLRLDTGKSEIITHREGYGEIRFPDGDRYEG